MIHVDLKLLISKAGTEEGARYLFQRLMASIVKIQHLDARQIRASPGDWGIDIIVGELAEHNSVWQVKYITKIDASQRTNINESFDTLMKNAKKYHFTVDIWTLCIACDLSPQELKWWNKWSKDKAKQYGVNINLMTETDIRDILERRDAEHIKMGYFGQNPTTLQYFLDAFDQKSEREIMELPEPGLFSNALFIQKLNAAHITEVHSAKTQFFNAELLTQEIIDKGDFSEITSLKSLKEKLRSLWETRFIESFDLPDDKMSILYARVMQAIETQDKVSLNHREIKASLIHKQGMLHQLSNDCQVGWTKNFREEFKEYRKANL